ncbi:MAG: nucleotidyltransferase family protein [Salinisphaera sp.]|nr:nucleotidyltransferase family protein [Salinisphaera sp.]MDN5937663.1 nucleotidyltransferase family protein [Salinisphaera sp.]
MAEQIRQAVSAFGGCKTPPALIGGVALAAHQVVRATRDVDFLVEAADADHVDDILTQLGYQCRYRSSDAANYVRDDEGLDLIYARRPKARQMLADASSRDTGLGCLRVISAESLIGLKLQALVNNPSRGTDREDILSLLRTQRDRLNIEEVRSYFALFDRLEQLDEWLAEIADENV